ncbi:TylF/MycF/NovP-related O-methyltransferase [Lignipirellula cremea]|uniref:Demethyldecarbamoylnovobiocin O-methyltransferase n=1 Tax=Lignipirellula cremea TaxID=2528010 RepID=A0A518E1N9_9BACT|nr:TylF/MycF/NovP-related O-methyltransferase [Lignipirellula cremea]QDU98009.1 Demethyldecarbamoylnovobiocin O-methyltransferase [Lignipirellula cremea]
MWKALKSRGLWGRKRKSEVSLKQLVGEGVSEPIAQTVLQTLPYTMTSSARIAALCEAIEYVVARNIPGDIVECGVWRGGSMMAVAHTLRRLGSASRNLHLCDTFEGMTPPSQHDVSRDGASAEVQLQQEDRDDPRSVWCVAGLDEVKKNMASTGYPSELLHYAVGPVEQTLPAAAPKKIALLRLDTDWYESTKHEMEHLFPRLAVGGVLIIDDYGHWQGARRAVDEYLEQHRLPLLLHRIDYTGRMAVIPTASSRAA